MDLRCGLQFLFCKWLPGPSASAPLCRYRGLVMEIVFYQRLRVPVASIRRLTDKGCNVLGFQRFSWATWDRRSHTRQPAPGHCAATMYTAPGPIVSLLSCVPPDLLHNLDCGLLLLKFEATGPNTGSYIFTSQLRSRAVRRHEDGTFRRPPVAARGLQPCRPRNVCINDSW